MPDEKPMSAEAVQSLAADFQADEQAARVRDFGEADAATYDQRVRDGASTIQHLEPEAAEIEPSSFDQLLDETAARLADRAVDEDRGMER